MSKLELLNSCRLWPRYIEQAILGMNKAVTQYLRSYAEPDIQDLQGFPNISVDHILVVPCFRETTAFAQRLTDTLLAQQSVLVVVVINQPPGPPERLNLQLRQYFFDAETVWQQADLSLHRAANSSSYWLVVNRFTEERAIPAKQGVGLARKIGCDLAVALRQTGICKSEWIFTSDADAHLPDTYFHSVKRFYGVDHFRPVGSFQTTNLLHCPQRQNISAAVFAARHIGTPQTDARVLSATRLYEQALDYYVRGLAWAGSPYAFHAIGSAMTVRADRYCQVRGFPKRAGGEDFYLLNKLAKLGHIARASDICIQIEARQSDRVPFGTGPAIEKIMAFPAAEFSYYAPVVFTSLKLWLDHIPQIWHRLRQNIDPLGDLPRNVQLALANGGIATLWPHLLRQADSPEKSVCAIHEWFDAFQTLKFVRRLQASDYPATPLLESWRDAVFTRTPPE